MLADPLTKGLTPKVFHKHTAHMGVIYDNTLFQWESLCVLYVLLWKLDCLVFCRIKLMAYGSNLELPYVFYVQCLHYIKNFGLTSLKTKEGPNGNRYV